MSPQKRNGRYIVRWREAGRQRSRSFDRRRDAVNFEAKVRGARQRGEPVLASSVTTLSELVAEWVPRKARNLEPRTAEWYGYLFDTHVEPYLGGHRLTDLRPSTLMDWQEGRLAEGAGATAIRRSAMLVSQLLDYAMQRELVRDNPARVLERPRQGSTREVRPLSPDQVEAVRSDLLARDRLGDAVLVSTLAYTGLRPGEALGLEWGHVRGRTVLVEQRNVNGELVPTTKTKRSRPVDLLGPVAVDLAEWKLAMRPHRARRGPDLVFPRPRGGPWNLPTDLNNWRRRAWRDALFNVGLPYGRPYDLRHSYASLLIHSGLSVVEVAAQLGHSPTMTLRTYGHLFAEAPERGVDAADLIRLAREKRTEQEEAL